MAAIAQIWHVGWTESHLGRVPDALLQHRRPADLHRHALDRLATTLVAAAGSKVFGFVIVHMDEIEQIYVAESARGTGVATALLRRGESMIATDHDSAWLAVVAENHRARRFYERQGWRDCGAFDNSAWLPGGGAIPVPCRHYSKDLAGHVVDGLEASLR